MHDSPIRSCRPGKERHAISRFSYGHIWLVAWLAIAVALLGRTLWSSGAAPQQLASASAAVDLELAEHRADNRPTMAHAFRPIEELRVGDRVVADNPDTDTSEQTAVDPAKWRLVRLYAEETLPDGTLDTIHVETLQPPLWLELFDVAVGAEVPPPLDLVEMGLPEDLVTTVTAVEPCPQLQAGNGRVVLTTVNHLNNDVWQLTAIDSAGRQEHLRPTGFHKFYSETRGDWVSTKDIHDNEVIRGRAGPLTIVDAHPLSGTQRVYNLTIEGEHVYYVSELGLLAHNNCPGGIPGSSRFSRVTTPWQRHVYQRANVDWDLVRPEGIQLAGHTNRAAARQGYTPVRINPRTGMVDDVVLHHVLDDPRGAVVEIWRSTHTKFHNTMSREPNPWRQQNPSWAVAWNNERSAYWRWRTGAYDPPVQPSLRLPGDP